MKLHAMTTPLVLSEFMSIIEQTLPLDVQARCNKLCFHFAHVLCSSSCTDLVLLRNFVFI